MSSEPVIPNREIESNGDAVNADFQAQENSLHSTLNATQAIPIALHQPTTQSPNLERVFGELCLACRSGDFALVDALLSTPNLDVNQVDEWDYSPLILLSLCGHQEIVELLLSRGAVCDRDTFQGARCVYGALNDTIRDLLISFEMSKAVDMSQPFANHISSMRGPQKLALKDIIFYFPHVQGVLNRDLQCFKLDRFLLAARSPYFARKLTGPWKNRKSIRMPYTSDPSVFKIIVDYIYLRTDTLPLEDITIQEALLLYAKKLHLNDLKKSIELIRDVKSGKALAKAKHDAAFQFVAKARTDLSNFSADCTFANSISCELDLDGDIDFEDIDPCSHLTEEIKTNLLECSSLPDMIVACVDCATESIIFYPVNKAMLVRSEVFSTMLKSDLFQSLHPEPPKYVDDLGIEFNEVIDVSLRDTSHIPVVGISSMVSLSLVAELILSFLYHDDVTEIPLMSTVQLLFAADELFLERLKTICAVNLTSTYKEFSFENYEKLFSEVGYDAFDLVRVAWQTRCDKLEQHMIKMISFNLSHIYHRHDCKKKALSLIEESASRIRQRQSTDTIEFVDDMRYYLGKKYSVADAFQDFPGLEVGPENDIAIFKNATISYERDIEMIDSLLSELQLDA